MNSFKDHETKPANELLKAGKKALPKNGLLPILLSRKEAAEALSVSLRTIDHLLSLGYFKPVRIGASVRIPVNQLKKFAAGDHPKLTRQT